MTKSTQFQWQRHPLAESFILNMLEECCAGNTFIAILQKDLLEHTSTRLFDWLDHVIIGRSPEVEKKLLEIGFHLETTGSNYVMYAHSGAQLPHVVVRDDVQGTIGIGVAVDSIADFLMVRGMERSIEGSIYSGYRRCCITKESSLELWVIERRGNWAFDPMQQSLEQTVNYLLAKEKWKSRYRGLEDEVRAISQIFSLGKDIISLVGVNVGACIVLECEREYWQSRNAAGQLQKNRQDRLGMGWANHDHHTFRSSRKYFSNLICFFEMFGFHCREKFYAGKDAGWGAQVMENPECRLVLFLDVDLQPAEIEVDFKQQSLPELKKLGTVGLWCALHGESILSAGMHHLEAQFMFEELTNDLAVIGVEMMAPFSFYPYLKQAFTVGENWRVHPRRLANLLEKELITPAEAQRFKAQGAIGSHMENLQRREGFKGFNQKNVSSIIEKTDPRKQ